MGVTWSWGDLVAVLFAHCLQCISKFGILLNTELHSSLECIPSDRKRMEISSCFKVVDSCSISSTEWSDTFRSFFVYGKTQESRKKYIITVQKKFHLPEEV